MAPTDLAQSHATVLSDRADELPAIIESTVASLCGALKTPPRTLTQDATKLLAAMPWRGGLAELHQALSRLVSTGTAPLIGLDDVLAHVRFDGDLAPEAPNGTLRSARQQFEREYIALVLQRHRWRIADTARALGIQRTNLYRKARKLGISVARPAQS